MKGKTVAVSQMSSPSPSSQLAHGHALRREGRLAEAAGIFREVLRLDPRNGHALHLLGITVGQMGRTEEAIRLISAAIAEQPDNAAMHTNLGNALSEIGREFLVIVSGKAKVSRSDKRLRILGVGEFFGEMALIDRAPHRNRHRDDRLRTPRPVVT